MERQKPTTSLKHNDDFSKALIESYGRWMDGGGFGKHMQQEETYPELQKKGGEDDFSKKDPKEKAGAPDPAVDLRTGSGIKQSHGATIKYTNVVAKEEAEKEEKKEKMEEAFNIYVEGVHYVFEKKNKEGKEQGVDGKACWKGYKYAGTENGKDKCVKAGYEPIGELMLDEKAPPGAKYERMVKHIKKGYSKGGVSDKEKSIAYATAWKAKNKEVKEEKEGADKKSEAKFHSKLDKLVHKTFGKSSEEKKMKEDYELTEKKLDPVGKEDKDIDNDGDHDKSDKYLLSRRKKVSKIINAKKKMREQAELRKEIEEEKK